MARSSSSTSSSSSRSHSHHNHHSSSFRRKRLPLDSIHSSVSVREKHRRRAKYRHHSPSSHSNLPRFSHRRCPPPSQRYPPQNSSAHRRQLLSIPRKAVDRPSPDRDCSSSSCPSTDSPNRQPHRRHPRTPRFRTSRIHGTQRSSRSSSSGRRFRVSVSRRLPTRSRTRRYSRRSRRSSRSPFSSRPARNSFRRASNLSPPRREFSKRRRNIRYHSPSRNNRMMSPRWNQELRPSRDEPRCRTKRLRTPLEHPEDDEGSGVSSREKRHRWMTPEELNREDQFTDAPAPYRSGQRQVYLSHPPSTSPRRAPPPLPSRSFHRNPSTSSQCPSPTDRHHDRTPPPQQQYRQTHWDQSHQSHSPSYYSPSHEQYNGRSRRPSPQRNSDNHQVPSPSGSSYVSSRPQEGGYDNHHQQRYFNGRPPYRHSSFRQQQRSHRSYRPYDRHRRSRRPSPWRRAPPYFRESQDRRRGRAGGNQYNGWHHDQRYHPQRQDDYGRDGYGPRSGQPTWRWTRRTDQYQQTNDLRDRHYYHYQGNQRRDDEYVRQRDYRPAAPWENEKRWKGPWASPVGKDVATNKYRHEERPRSLSRRSLSEDRSPKKQKSTKNEDEIVHFEWLPGMRLSNRFAVMSQLGEGTFGRVVECQDLQNGKRVAVKVVRDISRYTSAAQIEAEILEEVREKDPEGQSNCVVLIERFLYDRRRGRERRSSSLRRQRRKSRKRANGRCHSETSSINNKEHRHHRRSSDKSTTRSSSDENYYGAGIHMCLVSEKLGLSLFAFLSQNHYRGFFVEDIQKISLEVLKSLAFLRKIKLTHTDLKPENILFVDDASDHVPFPRSRYPARFWDGDASDISDSDDNEPHPNSNHTITDLSHAKPVYTSRPRDCRVKLIDFGSATFEDDSHCSLINTRQYRAPEVILQIGWSTPSDLWCLGCILMELYTGVLLFRTHEHLEHLALMERIVGPIPQPVLQAASKSSGSKYLSKSKTNDGRLRLDWPEGASGQKSLDRVKNCRPLEEVVLPCHRLFAEFVRFLLQIDPEQRPTPIEAMQHPFLRTTLPEC